MSVERVEGCSTREGRERLIKRLWGIVLRLVGQQAASERSGSATLLKHSALYLFARGLPGLVAFLSIAIYTRLLSPEAYGQYVLVVATVGLCNAIVFHWMRMGLLRFLPAHLEQPQALLSTLVTGSESQGMRKYRGRPGPLWGRGKHLVKRSDQEKGDAEPKEDHL
jgi:hypothetical protein